jgi:type II secretory pathway component PulF
MPSYSYKALDKGGKEIKGNIEATGEEAVVERLRSMGYYVTQVSRHKGSVGQVDLNGLTDHSCCWENRFTR